MTRMIVINLLAFTLAIASTSADQLQAVDVIPQNVSPIDDPDAECQVDAVFSRIHQLARQCGAQMREKHDRDEQENLRLIRSVGVLGNIREISEGRYHWALDFVNFVERMVGHKKQLTDGIFAELEERIQISETTANTLRHLHEHSGVVLNAILLKCRRQVTAKTLEAIRVEEQIHQAALQDCDRNESDMERWQYALEASALRYSEGLRQITEENLEMGYNLLDRFDQQYRQVVASNFNDGNIDC